VLRIVAERLAGFVVALLATAVVAFVLLDLVPGDPALNMLGTEAREDTLAAARALLGLDRPAHERLLTWLAGLPFGEFGISFRYRVPIADLVAEAAAVTVPLALLAMTLAVCTALPLALLSVLRPRGVVDWAVGLLSQVSLAVPNFWLGLLLILLFSITLGWLPAGGFPGWGAGIGPALSALLLPAIALAAPQAGILARVARAALLETLAEPYVRTARAKGLSRAAVLFRHALRNALLPVITVAGVQFSVMLAGSIIVENLFVLPGLGRLTFQAIQQNDLILVRNTVLLLAAAVMLVNLLVDLAYAAIDPRLRAQ
jgi:peptide/nickel transport system permease protein